MTLERDLAGLLYRLADEANGRDAWIELAGVPVLVVQDAASAQRVLRGNVANYEKNMPWFRQALGPSRMTENGEAWRWRQQLTQPHLARFDRARTFQLCMEHGEAALSRLLAASAAGAPRVDDGLFRDMAAAVMLESLFGRSLDETGVETADIAAMIGFGSDYASTPQGGQSLLPRERLAGFLDIRTKVLAALGRFRSGEVAPGSLLAGLRAAEGEGRGFVLEHELALFFAAGAETTAAAMGWACFLLARNPEIQDRLHAAADLFWSGGEPSWQQLEAVAPLRAFMDEVLRIFPPTPAVGRRAVGADALGAYAVAAGDQIIVSIVGLQHDRRLRADPWRVDLEAAQENDTSGLSLSFGIGPRVCGGARFAVLETVTFLATFLRHARFEPTSAAPPQFHWQSQLLHAGGQPVRAVAR